MGLFVLIMVGVFVSQRNAGLAYADWPLFNGKLTPAAHEIGQPALCAPRHRRRSWVCSRSGCWCARSPCGAAAPVLFGLSVAAVLFAAQVIVGAANIWFTLDDSVRILHLALASAVWCVLAFTMAWAYHNGQGLTKGAS